MQPLTTPHWLVFDLDETLAPTEKHGFPALIGTLQKELRKLEPSLPEDLQTFWAYIREKYPRTGNVIRAIRQAYNLAEEWEENIHKTASPSSAEAVLANLLQDPILIVDLQRLKAQGHQMHILTLGHADYAEPVLQHLGLHAIFTPNIHTRAYKRVPDAYQNLLDQFPHLATLPRMMVEDSPENLAPAKKLGFTTIGVGKKMQDETAADHIFPTIHDFLKAALAKPA